MSIDDDLATLCLAPHVAEGIRGNGQFSYGVREGSTALALKPQSARIVLKGVMLCLIISVISAKAFYYTAVGQAGDGDASLILRDTSSAEVEVHGILIVH